jgi:hypothetical protein
MVRQELTGSRETGWTRQTPPGARPNRGTKRLKGESLRAKQGAWPMSPGWLLEPDGNVRTRWMTATLFEGTEPGLQGCQPPAGYFRNAIDAYPTTRE